MPRSRQPLRILFSCVGRRVELIEAFRAAGKRLGVRLEIWGCDHDRTAPAMQFVDKPRIVPRISDPNYIDHLVGLARRGGVGLLIPLIDSDLQPLADAQERFGAAGCTVLVPRPETVRICRDKLAAYRHLSAAGIDTPRTWTLEQLLAMHDHDLPFFVKPRSGSAGAGLHLIETEEDLRQVRRWVDDPIIQEYVQGREYTMDVYTGLNGEPACVVPRLRLRVRGGEVCQSQVVLDPELIEAGREAVRALPGCVGVITIQCIRSPAGRIAVIEVNPRFGGGAPLSIAAGADFPRYILAQHLGRRIHVPPTARQDGLMMTRYDRSIFRKMPLA